MEALLNHKQVSEIVTFKRSRLLQMVDEGIFPKPSKFGRHSRWFKSDIENWLKEKKLEAV
jgi:predicted DNA-binding transcriptional regulator AlpA